MGKSLTNIALNVLFASSTGLAAADDRDGDALDPAAELFKCLRFTLDVVVVAATVAASGPPRPPECKFGRWFRPACLEFVVVVVEDRDEDALEAEEDPESESELPDPSPPELESDSDPSVDLGDAAAPRRLGCC